MGYENVNNVEIYKKCVTDSHLALFVTVDCSVNGFTKLSNDNTEIFWEKYHRKIKTNYEF